MLETLLAAVLLQFSIAARVNDYEKAVGLYKTVEQIENILYPSNAIETPAVFFPVAWCESRLIHAGKVVTRSHTNDVGIMQINEKTWLKNTKSLELNIYEKNDNIRMAYKIYLKHGLDPWLASKKCWQKYGISNWNAKNYGI